MRITAVVFVAGAVALSAGLAHAGDSTTDLQSRYTKAYRECPAFKIGDRRGVLDCIGAEFAIQDKRLNAAYAKAMAGLSAPQKAGLRSAQRAWNAYMKAWCVATWDAHSGTRGHVDAEQCYLDETITQTIKLEELARHSE